MRMLHFLKHLLKMRVQLQKCLGLGLTGFITELGLDEIHDVECFCVFFCSFLSVTGYVLIHGSIA